MTTSAAGVQMRRWFAALALGTSSLVGIAGAGLVAAHAQGAVQGVADWQVRAAIGDYVNLFMVEQRRAALVRLGHENFNVRVKLEGLTRGYNNNVGDVYVVQFTGAVVPIVADPGAVQDYVHGVMKIYLDKDKGVQVIINEGQGLWTQQMPSADLARLLPDDDPGDWNAWGGSGNPPGEPPAIASGDPRVERTPTTGSLGSSGGGDDKLMKLGTELRDLGARVAQLKAQQPPDLQALQQAQMAWQAKNLEYQAALRNKP